MTNLESSQDLHFRPLVSGWFEQRPHSGALNPSGLLSTCRDSMLCPSGSQSPACDSKESGMVFPRPRGAKSELLICFLATCSLQRLSPFLCSPLSSEQQSGLKIKSKPIGPCLKPSQASRHTEAKSSLVSPTTSLHQPAPSPCSAVFLSSCISFLLSASLYFFDLHLSLHPTTFA